MNPNDIESDLQKVLADNPIQAALSFCHSRSFRHSATVTFKHVELKISLVTTFEERSYYCLVARGKGKQNDFIS